MKELISKELFAEVMGLPKFVKHDDQIRLDENCIIWGYDGEDCDEVNIHELTHKCKEWVMNLESKEDFFMTSWVCYGYGYCDIKITTPEEVIRVYGTSTEPEAIFQACEWILKRIS